MSYFVQIVTIDMPAAAGEPDMQLLPGAHGSIEDAREAGHAHIGALGREQGCVGFRIVDASGHVIEREQDGAE